MRLAKFLAHSGVASRRAAERLIAAGRVTVAGTVITDPARDVDEGSGVRVSLPTSSVRTRGPAMRASAASRSRSAAGSVRIAVKSSASEP